MLVVISSSCELFLNAATQINDGKFRALGFIFRFEREWSMVLFLL